MQVDVMHNASMRVAEAGCIMHFADVAFGWSKACRVGPRLEGDQQ